MKKIVEKLVKCEEIFCNICDKEITHNNSVGGYNERIKMVRGLFSTKDFDAHEQCINKVVRSAFIPFVSHNK